MEPRAAMRRAASRHAGTGRPARPLLAHLAAGGRYQPLMPLLSWPSRPERRSGAGNLVESHLDAGRAEAFPLILIGTLIGAISGAQESEESVGRWRGRQAARYARNQVLLAPPSTAIVWPVMKSL